ILFNLTLTVRSTTLPISTVFPYTMLFRSTARDACGNTATATQVITIEDNTPPVFGTIPGPSTIECPAVPCFASPTATDACGTPKIGSASGRDRGACANESTVTRTYTARDGCGNTATATQ